MQSQDDHDELVMSLLETIMKHAPEERAASLEALRTNPALYEEVKALVEWEERMGDFLLDPLVRVPVGEHIFEEGTLLGERFRIVRAVGQGGMGIVYEAMDLQLDRPVALKCAKAGHRSRLPPEARAAREVSHFNVCKVYDLHMVTTEFGDQDFISMEFIDGETLSQRLQREGSVPTTEALEIALQICSGLEQAHRQGVIHGDLKCSNIILARAPEGGIRSVITDFGLAKLKFAEGSHVMSGRGGTFEYMSPELFRGEPATIASDLYALGVLFHAMLNGKAPEMLHPSLARALMQTWNADSQASTATINRPIAESDWQREIDDLDSPWKKIVTRCLAPSPRNRFGSAEEIRHALTHRAPWVRWVASAAVAVAIMLGSILVSIHQETRVQDLAQVTSATDLSENPSLSRDGKIIAYASDRAEAGNLDIWVQKLSAGDARRLTTDSAEDNEPNISPDGRTVAFRSERNGGGIYLVDTAGGNERLLVLRGRNPQFSPDGHNIVYWTGDKDESVPSGRVYLIPLTGGRATRLAPDFEDARLPIWSSDGRFILFSGCRASGQSLRTCLDWWASRSDGSGLTKTGAMDLLRQQRIMPISTLGAWWGSTVIFGGRHDDVDSLWQLPISGAELKAQGSSRQLTLGESSENAATVAGDGSLAFGRLSGALHVWRIDHAATPPVATLAKMTGEAAIDISPHVSHNGNWLVFGRGLKSHREIWLKDLRSGKEAAAVVSKFDKVSPLIDDSGSTIIYEQREPEASTIWAARDRFQYKLCTGCGNPTGWFGDSEMFFYSTSAPSKIMVMNVEAKASRIALDAEPSSIANPDWSPANQYLLFTASPDGSRKQVFAVHFPKATGQPVGQWFPITSGSEWSDRPRWSADGKLVFYLSNRDGSYCIWGQHFDPVVGQVRDSPFAVMHFHNPRLSPGTVRSSSFAMAVSGDSIFLNLGEETESIWVGRLERATWLRRLLVF
jgi:serine/threonine protein kinase